MQDLLAYSSLIVHTARKYAGDGWIQYNRNFRKAAAANPDMKWGEIHHAMAFVNAKTKEHYSLCFSLDHATTECDDYEPPKAPTNYHKRPIAAVNSAEQLELWHMPTPPLAAMGLTNNRYVCGRRGGAIQDRTIKDQAPTMTHSQ